MTAAPMTATAPAIAPRGALSAMLAGNFVIGMGVLAPAAMLNDLVADLAVSPSKVGLLVSYGALILCVGAPLLAYLTAAVPRRAVLAGALVLYGFGHIASAFATNFDMLLVIRLLMISGAAVFSPQAAATTGLIVPNERRAASVTYVFLGWSLASSFGMLLMNLGAHELGWRAAYIGLGLAGLAAAFGVLATVPKGLIAPPLPLSAWRQVVTTPSTMLVVSVTALVLAGQFVLFPYLAAELKRAAHAAPGEIAVLLSLFGFAGLAGGWAASRLVARVGAASLQALCLVTVGLGIGLFGLLAHSVIGAAIAILVWGLSFAAGNALQQARLITIAPAMAGASVALNTSAIYVGQAVGAAIGGALLAQQAFGLMAPVGAMLVVAALVGSILAQRLLRA
ncbi:MAG: MFS transporter [Caulobacterales bacterium]|jgi:predicted MFS family arabinose efflux permease